MDKAVGKIAEATAKKETFLDISSLGLTSCPVIPNTIKILVMNNNKITLIPKLHEGLTDLYVDNNSVKLFTNLPNSLELLSVKNNFLKALPPLPKGLKLLDCRMNYMNKRSIKLPAGCKIFLYPSFKDLLVVPPGSQNAVSKAKIQTGDIMVDFHEEAKQGRYYLQSTKENFEKPTGSVYRISPRNKQPIKSYKTMIAKVNVTPRNSGNNVNRTIKNNKKPIKPDNKKPLTPDNKSPLPPDNKKKFIEPDNENPSTPNVIGNSKTLG
jgi:hypothetical protein